MGRTEADVTDGSGGIWMLRTVGKGVLEKAFVNSVHAIEARNSLATERTA